jgi:hypothetical protein
MLIPGVLPLVSTLIGDVGRTPPSEILFTSPAQPRDITRIPSLNKPGIAQPNPRKGCVIGWKKPSSLPSLTEPMEIGDLREHIYGGPGMNPAEVSPDPIGHMYTKYGGIIDIGHVRDHADIARYIATKVVALFENGGPIDLGDDKDIFRPSTGKRLVKIKAQGRKPSAYQAAVLGAVISYDVAIWHEIATFKNWQDYSSFSPEDNYSNLLGAYLGFRACLTENLTYNAAMTAALHRTMLTMIAQSRLVALRAVEFVENHWYHYGENTATEPDVYLFLDRRHMETGYNEDRITNRTPTYVVSPWLITDVRKLLPEECQAALITNPPSNFKIDIHIPKTDENNKPLRDFYSFEIENPANADNTIFDNPFVGPVVDSTKFGLIVEAIRDRFSVGNLNFDRAQ